MDVGIICWARARRWLAVATSEYMTQNHIKGTLRYYGTPAEEGGSGKVYMVRAGLFKDVDVVLHWHPGDRNAVQNGGLLAVTSAKFTFHGIASHAAFAPERGRSALDAVMLMGNGLEFMREHVPSNARIHYIISKGGSAPNIVPDLAEMDLMARDASMEVLDGIWARILKVAQGAALMTETTLEVRGIGSDANIIPNVPLAAEAQRNLELVGGYKLDPQQSGICRRPCRKRCRPASKPSAKPDRRGATPAGVRSEPAECFDRRGRCELECADDRLFGSDVCAWRGGAYLAGGSLGRV